MGMLIAPVEVRDLRVDYIHKLQGSLVPASAGKEAGLEPQPGGWGTDNLVSCQKNPVLARVF